ncbi:MAG TPA: ATP-dependent Clp protease ATP-binding subunit [Candidatus Ornithocaccomicrobium faecavium]|uniref:ATP-dependent Clp protease ATP-binding subunit n=1 Tax=Candidatus Ornithocaccomicrobium faecavium TaxID=2840890 RepID=A0A9D1TDH5_9FIRM|nr:ATP-dependent Clp protease ATP-binding subunit [Candidatus Ornithocaccomicrobium faecavium]
MAMFSRFTERAQRVLVAAQKEAAQMGRNYVGTEHLLLGILTDPGSAAGALEGVTLDAARQEVIQMLGKGDDNSPIRTMVYTPRTKKVLEQSAKEARDLQHNYVGTEHLLLALIHEREGVAATILTKMGKNLQKMREEILRALSGEDSASGEKGQKKGNNTPTLDHFARDLTKAAQNGELDPVIGRTKEIERIVQILSRRTKNNPVLIGEPGVGKSAIVEGLAQLIVEGNIPEILRGKRVVSLDLAGMVAGAKYRGEFEERLKNAMAEIKKAGNVILFIDELHTMVGAGASEGSIDAANIMKPLLARGELQCVGATTLNEYHKYIEKDSALERRFQPVMVGEPTKEESVAILHGLRDRYEAHHRVRITDEAIEAAVQLSDRYIADRFLPDKAIDLIDEAASRVRIKAFTAPPDMKEQEARLEALGKETEEAVAHEDFEKAAQLRDEKKRLQNEIAQRRKEWEQRREGRVEIVGEEEVAQIVSSWTGIPVSRMTEGEAERLLHLEETLHSRVIGQDEAVAAVARAVRRARAGIKDPQRPIGSFIFLGPTGVGKTELCKALGEALFGDENSLIRIDMSEYMEKHSVSRMIGSPPGYVGYEEGGQLTEKVRRKPYSIVLLDEVEKAHPDVFNVLLQILEDGRLTDGQGRVVDFKNTVIVMTSNAGVQTIKKQRTMGFGSADSREKTYEQMRDNIMEEVKQVFRPEFLNRVDEIIVFHELTEEDINRIAALMLKAVGKRLAERGIELEVAPEAVALLAKAGFDPQYGARPLRRTIQRKVEDALSEEILSGAIHLGDRVSVTAEGEELRFASVPKTEELVETQA